MKYRLLPLLLAVIVGAAFLTACGSGGSKATGDEANNRVYPEGDGHLYVEPTVALTTDPTATDPAGSFAATQATTVKPTTKPKTTATSATSSAAVPTAVNPAATSAQPTIRSGIPDDNISGDNINPNIGDIQSDMMDKINALSVKSISLSASSLTLYTGESKQIEISFNPSNASNKTCTVSADNSNVTVAVSGTTITVTGIKAGTCTLTVTSHNGHTATCDITVKRSEAEVSDDTVLPHKDLVTVANAERWTAAVAAHLEELGMTRDTSLQGESVRLTTEDVNDMSYNSAEAAFVSQAEVLASAATGEYWGDFVFNCVLKTLDNDDYVILIAITQAH